MCKQGNVAIILQIYFLLSFLVLYYVIRVNCYPIVEILIVTGRSIYLGQHTAGRRLLLFGIIYYYYIIIFWKNQQQQQQQQKNNNHNAISM